MRSPYVLVIVALAALTSSGCKLLDESEAAKSPLSKAESSPDSVALEIFFARRGADHKGADEDLWKQVDEQTLPADVRRRLADNGFRVGVVGAPWPSELTSLLKLSDKPLDEQHKDKIDVKAEPSVTKRLLQARPAQPGELIASSLYDELPLLANENGSVGGRVYHKAQGVFTLKTFPEPNGTVRLELVPELQYGEPRLRRIVSEGMIRMEPGRDKKTFDELTINAQLAPGQMLVLTSRPERTGSVGHKFFSEQASEQRIQKLIIIRLAQAGADPLFAER